MTSKIEQEFDNTEFQEETSENEQQEPVEDMDNIQQKNPMEDIENLFKTIETRFNKIEKAMTVIQKWVKSNQNHIGRIDDNFKILMEK